MGAAIAYTGGVAIMAATAWVSRFPRYRTGIGAMAFLASDLLIFAGGGRCLRRTSRCGWCGRSISAGRR